MDGTSSSNQWSEDIWDEGYANRRNTFYHYGYSQTQMNTDVALFWLQEAIKTGALLAAPLLGIALAVGLVVSLLQAITSIQEMTLSYIPKMVAVGLILLIFTPWLIQILVDFATNAFQFIPEVSR